MVGHLGCGRVCNFSTSNSLKGYSPVQLVFCRDIFVPIKYKVDWELIRQQKQTQINKDNICENSKRIDHDYKVGDKVILNNYSTYKYEIPYNGKFVITHCCTNGTAILKCGSVLIKHNIYRIKPYTSDTNVEDIKIEKYV